MGYYSALSDDETEGEGVEKERTGDSELAEGHEGGHSAEEIHAAALEEEGEKDRCRWWLLFVRVTCVLFSFINTTMTTLHRTPLI